LSPQALCAPQNDFQLESKMVLFCLLGELGVLAVNHFLHDGTQLNMREEDFARHSSIAMEKGRTGTGPPF